MNRFRINAFEVLLTVNVIIIAILFYKYYHRLKLTKINVNKIEICNQLMYDFCSIRLLEMQSENQDISNVILIDLNGNEVLLSKIIKNKTLVLRFWENSCSTCIEDNLKLLEKSYELPVVVISSFNSKKNFKSFNYGNIYTKDIYMLESDTLLNNTPLENFQYIYYFIVDKDLKMRNVVAPINRFNFYITNYLNNLSLFAKFE